MTTVCAECEEPLRIPVAPHSPDSENQDDTAMGDGDNDTSGTVPDDVLLPCGDHFHWECLVDAYEMFHCPKCSADISSTTAAEAGASTSQGASGLKRQILVDVTNEGGFHPGYDIFPFLHEENYLRAYPEERKARSFLELCREGDVRLIVDLLSTCPKDDGTTTTAAAAAGNDRDDDDDDDAPSFLTADQILRYQDPLGDEQSGLHAAAANGQREVAWLLLLLASELPELEFPALVYQEAAALGVMRVEQAGKVDIRGLKDSRGRTAEDVAREEGGVVWNGWIGNGRLALPS